MVHKFSVAVMGRGLVCSKLLEYLRSDKDISQIDIFGSSEDTLVIDDNEYVVKKYDQIGQKHYDVVFGTTDADTIKKWFH